MTGSFEISLLPDADIADGGELLVHANIGAKTYQFLLDTGCAKTSIKTDDVLSSLASLGVQSSSGALGVVSGERVRVKDISLGPIKVAEHEILRIPENRYRSLFGIDILSNYSLNFCFRDRRVQFVEAEKFGISTFSNLARVETLIPHIEGSLGKTTFYGVWDTGAGATLVDLEFINNNPTFFKKNGATQGTDISNATVETPTYLMNGLLLGGHSFPEHQVVGFDFSNFNKILPTPIQVIFGVSTMMQADWFFDFPNRRWAITKTY